jgi:hypothetical protein
LSYFRKRIGEEGVQKILEAPNAIHGKGDQATGILHSNLSRLTKFGYPDLLFLLMALEDQQIGCKYAHLY